MPRTIEPELLDTLPPQHPDALHSRRDLRVINRILGNQRWFTRALRQHSRAGERVLEIGAGTGELSSLLLAQGFRVDALDLCPPPLHWPRASRWHRADLKTFSGYPEYGVIVGNLIFHHLSNDELAQFGAAIRSSTRVVIACEPARRTVSRILFRVLAPLFRANRVTLHDADVSIAAGFANRELPEALDLDASRWSIHCTTSPLGAYRMVAVRRA